MKKTDGKLFLYAGLGLLAVAFAVKWLGAPMCCFWVLLGLAVSFKILFLTASFRSKSIKVGLWFYFISAGVMLILLSFFFKNIILHNALFYGAILLKIAGLMLMFSGKEKRKKKKQQKEIFCIFAHI